MLISAATSSRSGWRCRVMASAVAVAFRAGDKEFFIYGFAKNERDNITRNELKALRLLSTELLSYGPTQLGKAMATGEIVEVSDDG